ncbi:hypothetical protein Afer_1861 [Acidimicrobium ferrooxidans DSM 10331]|uniref:Resolvase HTH domain-containing protein n=1 Tax=Acidimicrobium ferrooxidans (strain DSM 10331 / JCM 15462 / NBRC 103882 / ICP) TaxID=525909 RepID=C7M1C7_ACIFD|nr:hypothetical protein Afer_1861 [Acidimicrobium ferrooxidans DSM 10331]
MEDWALVRRLVAEGVPKARIAERLEFSRTTVVRLAARSEPPSYRRAPTDRSLTSVEARATAPLFADERDLSQFRTDAASLVLDQRRAIAD